jgi:methyltransferase (TIGR00027 family)
MSKLSRTCIWTAAARAFGALEPDPLVKNPDWMAAKLLGPDEVRILAEITDTARLWGQPYDVVSRDAEAIANARGMIPRTRFIDARMLAAVQEGATQVVMLGAGFDTRAYRFKEELKNARVFEVDAPVTQELKISRVRKAIGEPPENLTYVPVDFLHDDLDAALGAAGYRREEKTFFNWEGVTMYLRADAARHTLHWIAHNSPPGSAIVFDYTYDTVIQGIANIDMEKVPEQYRPMMLRFLRLTAEEPWIFGLPAGRESEFLGELGFNLRKSMGLNSKEVVDEYLTRADGSIFGNIPASEFQMYAMLEAVVA